MSVLPGSLDTEQQPPMTVPLRHFLVAVGFLLAGSALAVGVALGVAPGQATVAHVHLLLAGWVCVTIMGAMTQFVPVWSGVTLHSRRLAVGQLWAVTLGVLGFAAALLAGRLDALVWGGAAMLVGFWTFAYNVARTLWAVESLDVTERHFALALGFFCLLTVLGVSLAVDFVHPLFVGGLAHSDVVAAHATLAVFGAVLTTVLGALYQLATMFTQTELHGLDVHLRRFETVGYPIGVVLLAAGRLVGWALFARVGGLLVVAALAGFAVVLARRLLESRVPWNAMLRRYAVVPVALGLWAAPTALAWLRDPLASSARFGAPGTAHVLLFGVVGFVVFGTLYHVVPFIVWVDRYSDRLGFEAVPMIDDLYDERVSKAEFVALLVGVALVVAGDVGGGRVPAWTTGVGGAVTLLGVVAFGGNLVGVLRRHGPRSVTQILFGSRPEGRPARSENETDGRA